MFEREPLLAKYSYPLKLIALIIIAVLSLLFTTIFGVVFAIPFFGFDVLESFGNTDMTNPDNIGFLKYSQIVSQIGLFIIPPILFAYWASRKTLTYLKLNIKPQLRFLLISTIIIFIALPFLGWIGEINQSMELPSFLSGFEDWMKKSEEEAAKLIMAFLNVKAVNAMLFNVFMIAIIPGIGEELLFRGVVLKLFKGWIRNYHIAIIISAVLFSALHLQFYGFLPRLLLGLLLGYMYVWSGSLWVPIFIHFMNNAFAIIYVYASGSTDILSSDVEAIGTSENTFIIGGSFIFLCFLMLIMLKWYRDTLPNSK